MPVDEILRASRECARLHLLEKRDGIQDMVVAISSFASAKGVKAVTDQLTRMAEGLGGGRAGGDGTMPGAEDSWTFNTFDPRTRTMRRKRIKADNEKMRQSMSALWQFTQPIDPENPALGTWLGSN